MKTAISILTNIFIIASITLLYFVHKDLEAFDDTTSFDQKENYSPLTWSHEMPAITSTQEAAGFFETKN